MNQASFALMAFLPQANRLPGNTHIQSQLDGPNEIDLVQEFEDKSESDKLKFQTVMMMILIRYGNSEVSQLCMTCVWDETICLAHKCWVKFVCSSSEVVNQGVSSLWGLGLL